MPSFITSVPYTQFTPRSVSGCVMWFDTSDASYTTSGNTVSSWTNKTGNTNASIGGGTISINQATLNGKTSMRFPAGSNYFNINTVTYTTSFRNIFFVAKFPNAGNHSLMCDAGITGAIAATPTANYYGDIEVNYPGRNGLVAATVSGFFNTSCVLSLCTSTGNQGIWVTGNSQTITTNNLTTTFFQTGTTSVVLGPGGPVGAVAGDNIDMWEFIEYDGIITSNQRQQIEGYLAQKWGLTANLPGGHPGLTQTLYTAPKARVLFQKITYGLASSYTVITTDNSNYTIPAGVTKVRAFVWGAGGPSISACGGSAAYVEGDINVGSMTTLTAYINRGAGGNFLGSPGGGFGAIYNSTNGYLMIAGGGGGGGYSIGGGGGYLQGFQGNSGTQSSNRNASGGGGGSQTGGGQAGWGNASGGSPGVAGSYLAGGSAEVGTAYGSGGGGGYYGGGGGSGNGSSGYPGNAGGGGGSSYINTSFITNYTGADGQNGSATSNVPPGGSTSPYYQSGRGVGGKSGAGGGACVVIVPYGSSPSGLTVTTAKVTPYPSVTTSFLTVGSNTFTTTTTITATVLIVAGGGAGGNWAVAGGGGAGGILLLSNVTITPGSYPIIVGNGGVGQGGSVFGVYANNGSNSSAFGYTAYGGGAGGANNANPQNNGLNGGCGGGAGAGGPPYGLPGTGSQGSNGGNPHQGTYYAGGGGGGMGGVGGDASASNGGNGGPGRTYVIGGTSYSIGGGGGGSSDGGGSTASFGGGAGAGGSASGTSGTANTGGGGGAATGSSPSNTSGSGGSGMVIISYTKPPTS